MWIPDFLLKWIGQDIAKELKLEDTMENKPWYQTPSTLTHIFAALITVVTAGVGVYTGDFGGHVPDALLKVGSFLLVIAHGIGIYDNHS